MGEDKKRITEIEDLLLIEGRALQLVLREVDQKDVVIALKGVSRTLQDHVFANMSARTVGMVKEDMDVMGPVKQQTVGEAQGKLINVVNRLLDMGEITLLDQPIMKSETPASRSQYTPTAASADPDRELAGPAVSRRNLRQLVPFFVAMASKARREGLLGVEENVEAIDDKLLQKGMQLIVDGADCGLTQNTMEVQKKALLAEYERRMDMMIAAVGAISAGDNPRIVEVKCSAYLQAGLDNG